MAYPPANDDRNGPSEADRDDSYRQGVGSMNNDDLMYGDGEGVIDDLYDVDPVPRTSVSCVLDPTNSNRAYFFCGNRYAVIHVNPGTTVNGIVSGPKSIGGNWPSLTKASFAGGIDAVLPNPKNKEEMYFFCVGNYALVDSKPSTNNDDIIYGPKKIAEGWPSLRQAGFSAVDAVLPNPYNGEEAYFFSGEKYVLINIKPETNEDYIVNGPNSIFDYWPCLSEAGFETVDAILPNPTNCEEAYFFFKDQYALIKIEPGPPDSYIVSGPELIRIGWPSLHECCFW